MHDTEQPEAPIRHAALRGLLTGIVLMGLAMAVPAVTGWNVHVFHFPPLHADWAPRGGPGTIPAALLALVFITWLQGWADGLEWRRLLPAVFAAGLSWMLALAAVDGTAGWGQILATSYEYLGPAREITDVPEMLRTYVERIPYDAPLGNWPVHLAGHPPLAVLFFIGLVRIGLGASIAAGITVMVLAATTAPAVMSTVRVLGSESAARRAAPFLAVGPAAIWQAVSADAVFAAVASWGLLALAIAAVKRSLLWGALAGLLLGSCVMLSYGLPLLGILALTVLWLGGSWRPLVPAILAALVPPAIFAGYGFYYWDALAALHGRYWDGVASRRPTSYWIFGDLAALLFSAGPILAAGVGATIISVRNAATVTTRIAGSLSAAAVVTVLAADFSLMSKAEVERIWLPFVPWLLLSTALLPDQWRRRGLIAQIVFALVVQHLLDTGW